MVVMHRLKIEDIYYNAILAKEKLFEVRFNDRNFQKGDYIKFMTIPANGLGWSDEPEDRMGIWIITNVHMGLGLKDRYVVLGIKPRKPKKGE